MRKLSQKGFGAVEIMLVVVIIGLMGGAGYLVHQRNEDKKEQARLQQEIDNLNAQEENTAEEPAPEDTTLTEDEQILLAAECDDSSNCEIEKAEDRGIGGDQFLAKVSVSGEQGAGHIVLLSKESGTWEVLFSGNGEVPQDIQRQYDFPEGWLGPSI